MLKSKEKYTLTLEETKLVCH